MSKNLNKIILLILCSLLFESCFNLFKSGGGDSKKSEADASSTPAVVVTPSLPSPSNIPPVTIAIASPVSGSLYSCSTLTPGLNSVTGLGLASTAGGGGTGSNGLVPTMTTITSNMSAIIPTNCITNFTVPKMFLDDDHNLFATIALSPNFAQNTNQTFPSIAFNGSQYSVSTSVYSSVCQEFSTTRTQTYSNPQPAVSKLVNFSREPILEQAAYSYVSFEAILTDSTGTKFSVAQNATTPTAFDVKITLAPNTIASPELSGSPATLISVDLAPLFKDKNIGSGNLASINAQNLSVQLWEQNEPNSGGEKYFCPGQDSLGEVCDEMALYVYGSVNYTSASDTGSSLGFVDVVSLYYNNASGTYYTGTSVFNTAQFIYDLDSTNNNELRPQQNINITAVQQATDLHRGKAIAYALGNFDPKKSPTLSSLFTTPIQSTSRSASLKKSVTLSLNKMSSSKKSSPISFSGIQSSFLTPYYLILPFQQPSTNVSLPNATDLNTLWIDIANASANSSNFLINFDWNIGNIYYIAGSVQSPNATSAAPVSFDSTNNMTTANPYLFLKTFYNGGY